MYKGKFGEINADIDGDGVAELIEYNLLAETRVTRVGVELWKAGAWASIGGPAGNWNRRPEDVLLIGDIDGDGVPELVVFNNTTAWTGVLKWASVGVGFQTVWKSTTPLAGPGGTWNRRNDQMSIVGFAGGLAVGVSSPDGDWYGVLQWTPAPAPGRLELVELSNPDGIVGPQVSKWTYLADLVEVTGTVMPGFDNFQWDLLLDPNFIHLANGVRGSAGMVHCETYIITGGINRQVKWALPNLYLGSPSDPLAGKVWDFSSSPPAARDLAPYDRVSVRGQLLIENGHPISNGLDQGRGGDGWVFLELHPFDYRNLRLIGTPQPTDTTHGTVVVVAPLYEYNKWTSTAVSNALIWRDGGLFHSTVSAVTRVLAPNPPPAGVDPASDVFYRESVVHNLTGQALDDVRQIKHIPGGIEVSATVAAPVDQPFGGIRVADVNGPANGSSILVIEYDVAWRPLPRGHLWHTGRSASGWVPVGDVNAQIGQPGAVVAVAATSAGSGQAQFIMATSGGHLWHTIRSANGGWQPAGNVVDQLGYFGPVSSVSATSAVPGEAQYLFATDDGHLWHTVRSANGGWQPATDATASIGSPGRAIAVAATSADPGEAQFLFATDDGHLWHTRRSANGGWAPAGDVNAQIVRPPQPTARPGLELVNPGHPIRDPAPRLSVDLGRACAVAATSPDPGEAQFLFATEHGPLWHTTRFADGTWQFASEVDRQIGSTGDAIAVAATSAQPGHAQYLFSSSK